MLFMVILYRKGKLEANRVQSLFSRRVNKNQSVGKIKGEMGKLTKKLFKRPSPLILNH